MSMSNFVKRIQDIMRNDSGVNGDAQRIEQIVWLLFLKVYDSREVVWEFLDTDFESIIPEAMRWRNWAVDKKDDSALTGDELLDFVNNELLPTLKNLSTDKYTPKYQKLVKKAFEDSSNYMKDGVLLRQVVNVIDEIDFSKYEESHAIGNIYENILKSLQSAGNAGEFYTNRALTTWIINRINVTLGEKVADFACGTGGFLTSALEALDKQVHSEADREIYQNSVYGIEKKQLPYLLCVTNLLLHEDDNPCIVHGNALETDVRDYSEEDKFDVITMNPPFGGSEKEDIRNNFPLELRSSKTADLFMNVIMYRLKKNGRAAVIIPDGFLFGTDNAKIAIKTKMLKEFNLHTVIRLPRGVFSPYTYIPTNILFFDNTKPTEETWFYRLDVPEGYKNYSKRKPMKLEHLVPVTNWWDNREEMIIDGCDKAKKYSVDELLKRDCNLDLCGYSNYEEDVLPPKELIQDYLKRRESLNDNIDRALNKIIDIIGLKDVEVF